MCQITSTFSCPVVAKFNRCQKLYVKVWGLDFVSELAWIIGPDRNTGLTTCYHIIPYHAYSNVIIIMVGVRRMELQSALLLHGPKMKESLFRPKINTIISCVASPKAQAEL